ncbi:hypothetical protein [Kitasatospora sp. NPDC093806]|uniref:hypothetical protein n=1 Tax=Kitasatospora sp. NPDC093806 TaxID=3155075 RepID=UPI003422DF0D
MTDDEAARAVLAGCSGRGRPGLRVWLALGCVMPVVSFLALVTIATIVLVGSSAGVLPRSWGEAIEWLNQVDDPRACEPSTLALDDALDHFGFRLPEGAENVRFVALESEWELTVGFDLPAERADDHLREAGLPAAHEVRWGPSISGCTVGDVPGGVAVRTGERGLDARIPLKLQVTPTADPGKVRVAVEMWDFA